MGHGLHKFGHGVGKDLKKVDHGIGVAGKAVGKGTVVAGKWAANHAGTIGTGILAGVTCATMPFDGGATGPECAMASAGVAK